MAFGGCDMSKSPDLTGSLFVRGSSVGPISMESDQIKLIHLSGRNIIFGRPGTGKTTALANLIREFIASGHNQEEVAYLTYNRSMASEGRKKLGLNKQQAGTLHSVLSQLLGWRKSKGDDTDFLTDKDIEEFCEKWGIEKKRIFRAWEEESVEDEDDWGKFMLAYDSAKNRVPAVPVSRFLKDTKYDPDFIAAKYDEMKLNKERHDYTDILMEGAELSFPPKKLLVLDEAQDMTELMWKIIDAWSLVSSTVVYAGDDLQSIYGFRGARAKDFLDRREGATVFHLSQSHRMTVEVKELSDMIAKRIKIKEEVNFKAKDAHSDVHRTASLEPILTAPGERWILCTTNWIASQVAKELDRRRIVYLPINYRHRKITPWSEKLIRLVNSFSSWPNLEVAELAEVIKLLPASIMERGVKTLAKDGKIKEIHELLSGGLYGDFDLTRIFKQQMSATDVFKKAQIPDAKKELALKFLGKKILPEDVVRVDTYHASKGLECPNVGVILNMTRRVQDNFRHDPDSAYRNLYVAVTRSMGSLYLINLNIERAEVAYDI